MNTRPEDENPWTTLSERVEYDNPWIRVTEFQVLNPKGRPGIYGVVHYKNLAIGVIPVSDDGFTWLVGQYRYALKHYSWEIPEGGGKAGVDPVDSARRELLEETGLVANTLCELQRLHLSNSVSDELGIIYLATGLEQHQAQPEDTEELKLRKLSLQEAWEMVDNGSLTDSLTVAGLQRLRILFLQGLWAPGQVLRTAANAGAYSPPSSPPVSSSSSASGSSSSG